MGFGKNVKTIRKSLKMTQEELAHLVGYKDRSFISAIENDLKSPACSMLPKFAEALHCPLSALLEQDPSETREQEVLGLVPYLINCDETTFNIIKTILKKDNT